MHKYISTFLAASLLAPAAAPAAVTSVYHVGNSLTDALNYPALAQMASSRGNTYDYGRHTIPGAPLSYTYDNPNDGVYSPAPYPAALTQNTYSALTLQPFDRQLTGPEGDLASAHKFIDLARAASPNLTLFIYQRWPRRTQNPDGSFSLDYQTRFDQPYTGNFDFTNETRDYFTQLTAQLQSDYPALTVRQIPVGEVLYQLDRQMAAGIIPGYTDVSQLYIDEFHLTPAGEFVVGTTFYAALFNDDPIGLSPAPYGTFDPAFASAVQQTVRDTVLGPAGAAIPEPASLTLLAAGALTLLRRRPTPPAAPQSPTP